MARAKQSDLYTISLFSMLNILKCVLGVLIFILLTLAMLSAGPGRTIQLKVSEGEKVFSATTDVHRKTPHYIEWDGNTLLIHPGRETVRFREDFESIDTFSQTYEYMEREIDGTPLEAMLQEIGESNGSDYIVLLVRPSGFSTLYEIRGYIESRGIALGYEPIMQGWNVRVPE